MFKTLTAGLMALSLTLVPAAPVQAQQNNAELNRAIIGLLAAGALGLAIKNNQDKREESRAARAPENAARDGYLRNTHNQSFRGNERSQGYGRALGHQRRTVDLIPGRCFRRVETARGDFQGVFTSRCLERRYRDAATLPRQCEVRIGGRDGHNRGYDASCLRDFGYRSDRRWN